MPKNFLHFFRVPPQVGSNGLEGDLSRQYSLFSQILADASVWAAVGARIPHPPNLIQRQAGSSRIPGRGERKHRWVLQPDQLSPRGFEYPQPLDFPSRVIGNYPVSRKPAHEAFPRKPRWIEGREVDGHEIGGQPIKRVAKAVVGCEPTLQNGLVIAGHQRMTLPPFVSHPVHIKEPVDRSPRSLHPNSAIPGSNEGSPSEDVPAPPDPRV